MKKNKIILTIEVIADADSAITLAKSMLYDIHKGLTKNVAAAGLSEKMKLTRLESEIYEFDNIETPGKSNQYVN